jgi:Domain of unknown function (DUF4160)
MPCVSRFYGVLIYQYPNDHNPPHFHAKYAGADVAIEIESLQVLVGRVPPRAMALVREWAAQHQQELMENWNNLRAGQNATAIEPLP